MAFDDRLDKRLLRSVLKLVLLDVLLLDEDEQTWVKKVGWLLMEVART